MFIEGKNEIIWDEKTLMLGHTKHESTAALRSVVKSVYLQWNSEILADPTIQELVLGYVRK